MTHRKKEAYNSLGEMMEATKMQKSYIIGIDFSSNHGSHGFETKTNRSNKNKCKEKIKKLKKKLSNKEAARLAARDMADHYEELFTTAVSELKFKNMKVDFLLSLIYEIEELTDDNILKKVIENGLERQALDTIIHNKLLIKQ